MIEQKNKLGEGMVACDVCLKEIPRSEAKVEEASDYVVHFCGLECYDKWRHLPISKQFEGDCHHKSFYQDVWEAIKKHVEKEGYE